MVPYNIGETGEEQLKEKKIKTWCSYVGSGMPNKHPSVGAEWVFELGAPEKDAGSSMYR